MRKMKKTWPIAIGAIMLALVGGFLLTKKDSVAAGNVNISVQMPTMTFEQTDYNIPLAPSDLFVVATDSEGNDVTESLTISKIVKKNVVLDRTSGYGKKTYQTEDITSSYKNSTVIENANGIYEITYGLQGASAKVTVQAGDFIAPQLYSETANENPATKVGVAPETEILMSDSGIAGHMKAVDVTATTFTSFDVLKNGVAVQSDITTGTVTVGSGESYDIVATATDAKGNSTIYKMNFYEQYSMILDFEDRAVGTLTQWADANTILCQRSIENQIITEQGSKKLQVNTASNKWGYAYNTNYKGVNFVYGLGLFNLPMTNSGEYKATVEVSIDATYAEGVSAQESKAYIGYPNVAWTEIVLGADGKFHGTVSIDKVQLAGLSTDSSPYNCAYGIYNRVLVDSTLFSSATITIDNFELIPLVSEKNAIISTVDTDIASVDINETFSLLPEAYGLVATDYRGLPVKSIELSVMQVTATGEQEVDVTGKTELSSDVATAYKLIYSIEDYYGNTATQIVRVYVGGIEFDAPVITVEDEKLLLAGGTKITFGDTPNKYFQVSDASNYTLTYSVKKNGILVDSDVTSYDLIITKGDVYEIAITATDVCGNSATSTLTFQYVGSFVYDFEDRAVGTLTQWADANTLLSQKSNDNQIITEQGSKKLQVNTASDKWAYAYNTNYKGVNFVYGLGLFDLPMTNSGEYKATVEVSIDATYAEGVSAQESKAYIGYPNVAWTEIVLGADGKFHGTVSIDKVQLAGLSTDSSPYNCAYGIYNRVLVDSTLFSSATITIDNFILYSADSSEQKLATGSSVTFDAAGATVGINAANYTSFTYTVEKNNSVVAKDVATYTIENMAATDYYEVWTNATDKYGNVESKYMLYVGENVNMTTFSTMTTSMLTTTNGFIGKYYTNYTTGQKDIPEIGTEGAPATKEIYTDASGNKKLRIVTTIGTKIHMYVPYNYYNFGTKFSNTLSDSEYETYIDFTIKIKLKEGATVPTGSIGQKLASNPFTLTLGEDGWYTYSGTIMNWEYGYNTDTPGYYTNIVLSDYTNIAESIIEIDNIRWKDLR